eukprot:CAMPEP_0177498268 /NCGR_PEP_ID=MMETSP0369-20130122/35491_1 /TAXON_ID=447022 ORGANISM="Scrippsiella hangoei-like, Strain SHHI-4" /NCGR_SAMPLE_ID=MMETSP0369 /ASSEMBLY_ACC=CAM_ASM_000364 /LENGTH=121 /DNA_ID=CAMNT_0018975477 /DNA_START=86 /DNA_END=448 /DNA_ORIENTATION=-
MPARKLVGALSDPPPRSRCRRPLAAQGHELVDHFDGVGGVLDLLGEEERLGGTEDDATDAAPRRAEAPVRGLWRVHDERQDATGVDRDKGVEAHGFAHRVELPVRDGAVTGDELLAEAPVL